MGNTRAEIMDMLLCDTASREMLFESARRLRNENVGDGVYLRGLIEYSNVCRKNCLYCGIRAANNGVARYTLAPQQVFEAARFAYENQYGSIVLQGGEQINESHIAIITNLIAEIKLLSNNELGITLSMGEQTRDTYRRWFEAGAHRYLLRIETSSEELYRRIHPNDGVHSYAARLQALSDLRKTGFQVGTGVMVGLPFQTTENLADDILFMKQLDIDMCGMGPYIVSEHTPLADYASLLENEQWRFEMTLRMIAVLRIMMPDINIAATTALQAIDPRGRLKAIECGANVVMPNISPLDVRANYSLYNNKPLSFDSSVLEQLVMYGQWGDSQHFKKR